MSVINITAEISDETSARLSALLERLGDLRPFWEGVAQILDDATRDNFNREHAPDGTPWAAWAPSTRRRRSKSRKGGLRILTEGGDLNQSIVTEYDAAELRQGTNIPYGAIHQFGGTIEKAAGTRWMEGRRFAQRDRNPQGAEKAIRAHTITIPARPFLGVSPEDEVSILETAEDWLSGNR